MMIAFITINSGLVPLIEGLCAQIYTFKCCLIVPILQGRQHSEEHGEFVAFF